MTSFVMTSHHCWLQNAMPINGFLASLWMCQSTAGNLHTKTLTAAHDRQSSKRKLGLGFEW